MERAPVEVAEDRANRRMLRPVSRRMQKAWQRRTEKQVDSAFATILVICILLGFLLGYVLASSRTIVTTTPVFGGGYAGYNGFAAQQLLAGGRYGRYPPKIRYGSPVDGNDRGDEAP